MTKCYVNSRNDAHDVHGYDCFPLQRDSRNTALRHSRFALRMSCILTASGLVGSKNGFIAAARRCESAIQAVVPSDLFS